MESSIKDGPERRDPKASRELAPVTSAENVGRRTGRGGLAVTAAKIYFILTGLAQQVVLKAVLGLPAYGALSSALGGASIVYNPLVAASIQGVSHAVATSAEHGQASALRRVLADMHPTEAMELVLNRMRKTRTNAEFLLSMNLG